MLNNVAQQFEQGNLECTDNALDLGISGQGFFALAPNETSNEVVYTRAGAFNVNNEGFVTNSAGQFLRAFNVNDDGTVTSTSISSTTVLQLPSTAGTPQATTNVALARNAASTAVTKTGPIDTTDSSTFNDATSVGIFDSLGNEHIVNLFYRKTSTVKEWEVEAYIAGEDIVPAENTAPVQLGATQTLTFDPTLGGDLAASSTTDLAFTILGTEFVSGAAAQTTTIIFKAQHKTQEGLTLPARAKMGSQ